MNKTYLQYKEQIQSQLKGHRTFLFLVPFITTLLISACSYGLQFLFNNNSVLFIFLEFIFSLFCSLVNYVVLFLFIKCVRNEPFQRKDLHLNISSIGALLVSGIILSAIQMIASTLSVFLAFVPPLFYIVISMVNVLCILWNSLIAYRVYDHETSIRVLIVDNFKILKRHISVLLRGSLLYIIWFVLAQIAILIVIIPILLGSDVTNMNQVLSMFFTHPQAVLSVLGIYILYYVVQFYLLVPLYLLSANIYEDVK